MTDETHYYRVDGQKSFTLIKDGVLRACYWTPAGFPHKTLRELHKQSPGQRLYRVCFYDTQEIAERHRQEFSSPAHINESGVHILTRWPRSAPTDEDFIWSADDGFNPGQASLFYVQQPAGGNLSEKGIPLSKAELWDDAQKAWVPLLAEYPTLDVNSHAQAPKSVTSEPVVNPVGGMAVNKSKVSKGILDRISDLFKR